MTYNDYHYSYIQLMTQAEQALSRQEAIHCIQQATRLKEVLTYMKTKDIRQYDR
jgi:hypothetical protein